MPSLSMKSICSTPVVYLCMVLMRSGHRMVDSTKSNHSLERSLGLSVPPLYMLKTIESKVLNPNYVRISLSSNRPNITYATHGVTDIKDWHNYQCFIQEPFDLATQPRVLIFIQNSESTVQFARALNRCLLHWSFRS